MFQSPQMTTSRPFGLQFQQVRQEHFHEAELGFLALRRGRAGRAVHRDHGQIAEIAARVAALGIEFRAAEADAHGVRLAAAVDAGARIALLFGVVEMAVVAAGREEFLGHVGFLGLQFLDADEVGVCVAIQLKKPFLWAERMPFRLAEIIFGMVRARGSGWQGD
jgi:hypothetical protein